MGEKNELINNLKKNNIISDHNPIFVNFSLTNKNNTVNLSQSNNKISLENKLKNINYNKILKKLNNNNHKNPPPPPLSGSPLPPPPPPPPPPKSSPPPPLTRPVQNQNRRTPNIQKPKETELQNEITMCSKINNKNDCESNEKCFWNADFNICKKKLKKVVKTSTINNNSNLCKKIKKKDTCNKLDNCTWKNQECKKKETIMNFHKFKALQRMHSNKENENSNEWK
jgi:hypothetical protein